MALSKWARDEAALLAPLCPASWLSYSAVRMYCRAGGGTERLQTELDGVPTALKRSEKRGGVGGGGDVRELAHCSPSPSLLYSASDVPDNRSLCQDQEQW